MSVRQGELTDEQWALIQPLLPPPKPTGRPRADDRRTLEGNLYVLRTGCRWRDLPQAYGAPTTCWTRLRQWEAQRVWERIWRVLLSTLDAQGKRDGVRPAWRAASSRRKRGKRRRVGAEREGEHRPCTHRWCWQPAGSGSHWCSGPCTTSRSAGGIQR